MNHMIIFISQTKQNKQYRSWATCPVKQLAKLRKIKITHSESNLITASAEPVNLVADIIDFVDTGIFG